MCFLTGSASTTCPRINARSTPCSSDTPSSPHLDVYDNIAFGLRLAKLPEAEIDDRVTEMLEIVSLKGFENRKVTSLSGGQQQRVAIARALVNRPQVLLLDEPPGALDLRLRKDMQNELKNIQQRMGITFIYVTHDQEEALTMSDTIVVMDKGKIQQIGTPEDIYNEPKNAFVADFIGESNILDGVMLEDYQVKFFGRKFQCVDKGFAPNEPVDVVIRPEDIDIVPPEQGHLTGTVTSVTFKGVHYDTIVDFKGFKWLIQTTDYCPVDSFIGIRLNPEDIHIMHKSEYSGSTATIRPTVRNMMRSPMRRRKKPMKNKLLAAPYIVWMVALHAHPARHRLLLRADRLHDRPVHAGQSRQHRYVPADLPAFDLALAFASLICLVIGYPVAYFIAQCKPLTQRFLEMLIMLPMHELPAPHTRVGRHARGHRHHQQSSSAPSASRRCRSSGTNGAVILGMVYNYLPYMIPCRSTPSS